MALRVLRTPVNVTLRRFARGSDAVSACWNRSLAGGHGGWQTDGCRILGHYDNFTTISCNSLSNYGLLMVGRLRCENSSLGVLCFILKLWGRKEDPARFISVFLHVLLPPSGHSEG